MKTNEIYQRLTQVFHDVFDDTLLSITAETSAQDVDGWDSLMHIRLMLSIEKEFGVHFSAADIGTLKTVGNLVALIERKLAA